MLSYGSIGGNMKEPKIGALVQDVRNGIFFTIAKINKKKKTLDLHSKWLDIVVARDEIKFNDGIWKL
jgi:hypothetical protein